MSFFHILTYRRIWMCVLALCSGCSLVTAFIPEHIIRNSSKSTTVTPSVQSLVLNRQIYNKMEINGTQACHWVVRYQRKPPGPAMAPIATAAWRILLHGLKPMSANTIKIQNLQWAAWKTLHSSDSNSITKHMRVHTKEQITVQSGGSLE